MVPHRSQEERREYIRLLIVNARRRDLLYIKRSPEVREHLDGHNIPVPKWDDPVAEDCESYLTTGRDAEGKELINITYGINDLGENPVLCEYARAQLLLEGVILEIEIRHNDNYSYITVEGTDQD